MLILMKLFDLIARVFYFLGDCATRVKTSLWNSKTGRGAQMKKLKASFKDGSRVRLKKQWRDEITEMKEGSGSVGWKDKRFPTEEQLERPGPNP